MKRDMGVYRMSAYRIVRNDKYDGETKVFATLDDAKPFALEYVGMGEDVAIRDNNSGYYARYDREMRDWVTGVENWQSSEELDLAKARSLMTYAIAAIGNGQFNLDSLVVDRDELGREFRLGKGLEVGQIFEDEFLGEQREYVRRAFNALGADHPISWVKGDVCRQLLEILIRRR